MFCKEASRALEASLLQQGMHRVPLLQLYSNQMYTSFNA